jgi:hypothetical protein
MSVQETNHQMFELIEGVAFSFNSLHKPFNGRGWFRVSNEGVVKSIWVEQPDGSRRLFVPYKEEN